MTNPIDPLAHLPDPDKRYQAWGVLRGDVPTIEVVDVETRTGFILDFQSALQLGSDIVAEAVRLMDLVAERDSAGEGWVDSETIDRDDPRWQATLWRRPSNN